jgi:hypothetical protein
MGLRHSRPCEDLPDLVSLIKSEALVIFICNQSKACFKSIELLKSLLLRPFIVNIEYELNIPGTRRALFQLTRQYDLPMVFLQGKFFGSYKELKASISSGSFQNLLSKYRIKFNNDPILLSEL